MIRSSGVAEETSKAVRSASQRPFAWMESPGWRVTLPDVASVTVLVVLAALVFTTYDDFAISWDEPIHLSYLSLIHI